jgi:hypothetical protein
MYTFQFSDLQKGYNNSNLILINMMDCRLIKDIFSLYMISLLGPCDLTYFFF